MARKVLGNDPFRRGAADRPDAPEAPKPAAPPGKQPRPVTPELQVPRAPKLTPMPEAQRRAPVAHAGSPKVKGESTDPKAIPVPPPRAPVAPRPVKPSAAKPRAHAGAPSVPFEPVPHASAPSATPIGSAPRPHPGSPSVPFEATPHDGTPAATPIGSAPRPHAGSPSVPFEPATHPGAPEVPFEAVPHPSAPTASPARPPFRPSPPVYVPPAADALPRERALAPTPPATVSGAIKGLWRALRTASGLPTRATEVDAWGKDAELARLLRPLGEVLYEKYWRVHTEGVEHVPRGPCLLVANHAGALPLDGPVLHLALKRERPELADARWLLEDQVFHAPFVGLLANRLGAVRASPENALKLLSEGRPVIVFPEGFHGLSKSFSERYQLRRFGRGGYLKIAIRAGVPVVPVAIVGGEESMPLLAKVPGSFLGVEYLPVTLPPLPARWFLRFAPPIDFAGAPAVPEDDLAWIERTNVAVRDQIEAMLGALLAQRPKVF